MNENLHSVDEIFNEAHRKFSEKAPEGVWEKLQAGLDSQDAEKFRRRFIGWRKIAILLMFLLSGVVIYELAKPLKKDVKAKNMTTGRQPHQDNFPEVRKAGLIKKGDSYAKGQIVPQQKVSRNFITTNKKIGNGNLPIEYYNSLSDKTKALEVSLTQKDLISDNHLTSTYHNSGHLSKSKKRIDEFFEKSNVLSGTDKLTPEDKMKEINVMAIVDPAARLHRSIDLSTIENNRAYVTKDQTLPPGTPLTVNNNSKSSNVANGKFKPYWTFTPFISNDWAMYRIDNEMQVNFTNGQDEKEEVKKRERHEASYSLGATITRYVSKHIGIKTGFVFSNTSIAISPQEIYATRQDGKIAYKYITSSGYGFINPAFGLPPAIGDSLTSAEAQHNLQSVSIPVSVSFKMDRKKFSIVPSAGLTANFITRATVKTEVSDVFNHESVNITRLNGTMRLYAGIISDVNIQYHLNSKLALSVLPTFKYALSPITKDNVVKTFPYSFGIATGVTIKL